MISLSINDTTRAAALDGALAFSLIFEEHRDLVSKTISSGVRGLLQSLDEFGEYYKALNALSDTTQQLGPAIAAAQANPFSQAATGSAAQTSSVTAVNNGIAAQTQGLATTTNNAVTTATNARNGTISGTAERAAADAVLAAANKAKAAVTDLQSGNISSGDTKADQALAEANAARTQALQAKTAADTTLSQAQAARNALNGKNPPATPAEIAAADAAVTAAQQKVNAAAAVVTAANTVVSAAQAVVTFTNDPIVQVGINAPGTHQDLGNGYVMSTWGNSGYVTLTGPDGKGILIQPDGKVDPLDGAGNGWQFQNTSTFVLPDETKVTFDPGNPASFTATRGRHYVQVGDIKAGQTPTVTHDSGGRGKDKSKNDGYRIDYAGTGTDGWKIGGSTLGDGASREVVATSAITNELKIDATDVPIPQSLRDFLDKMGVDPSTYDMDLDGKSNEEELFQVALMTISMVAQLQASFQSVLDSTARANNSLRDLNRLLEDIRDRGQNTQDNRAQTTAAEKESLVSIQRRLEAALAELSGGAAPTSADANVGAQTQKLLTGLQEAAGAEPLSAPPSGGASPPQQNTVVTSTTPTPPSQSEPDPTGQALRRASKLISGFGAGPTIPDFNPISAPKAQTDEKVAAAGDGSVTPPEVSLLSELSALLPATGSDGTPNPLASGLQELVASLAAALEQGGEASITGEKIALLTGLLAVLEKAAPAVESTAGAVGATISTVAAETGLAGAGFLGPRALSEEEFQFLFNTLLSAQRLKELNKKEKEKAESEAVPGASGVGGAGGIGGAGGVGSVSDVSAPRDTSDAEAPTTSQQPTSAEFAALDDLLRVLEDYKNEAKSTVVRVDFRGVESVLGALNTLQPLTREDSSKLQNLLARLQSKVRQSTSTDAAGFAPNIQRPVTREEIQRLEELLARLQHGPNYQEDRGSGDSRTINPLRRLSRSDLQREENLLNVLQNRPLEGKEGIEYLAEQETARQQNLAGPNLFEDPNNDGVPGGSYVFADSQSKIKQIIGNFATDPEFLKRLQENLNKTLRTHNEHISLAKTLFAESQETVQKFVHIVSEDDVLKEVVKDDGLSDEKKTEFADKMGDLRKKWGVEWGDDGSGANTPTEEAKMVSRMMQSGTMI